jgi:thymidine kinase
MTKEQIKKIKFILEYQKSVFTSLEDLMAKVNREVDEVMATCDHCTSDGETAVVPINNIPPRIGFCGICDRSVRIDGV